MRFACSVSLQLIISAETGCGKVSALGEQISANYGVVVNSGLLKYTSKAMS
jgi:hypothetical protein